MKIHSEIPTLKPCFLNCETDVIGINLREYISIISVNVFWYRFLPKKKKKNVKIPPQYRMCKKTA